MSDNIERPCTGVRDCGGEGVDWDVKPEGVVIVAYNQGGNDATEVVLSDLLKWVADEAKTNPIIADAVQKAGVRFVD